MYVYKKQKQITSHIRSRFVSKKIWTHLYIYIYIYSIQSLYHASADEELLQRSRISSEWMISCNTIGSDEDSASLHFFDDGDQWPEQQR